MVKGMRWLLFAGLAVVPFIGAGIGMVVVEGKPPVYSAEARLSMGRADLVDPNTQTQAANYARYVTPAAVLGTLPGGTVISVSASPIPDTNIIRIEATAADPTMAVEAAKVATKELQTKVSALAGQAKANQTLARLNRVARQVSEAQSAVNASGGTGGDFVNAQTQLTTLQAQQSALNGLYQSQATGAAGATLTLLSPATATGDNVASRRQIYLLAGFGAGALLAYVIARLVLDVPWPVRRSGRSAEPAERAPQRVAERSPERAPARQTEIYAAPKAAIFPFPDEIDLNDVEAAPHLLGAQPSRRSERPTMTPMPPAQQLPPAPQLPPVQPLPQVPQQNQQQNQPGDDVPVPGTSPTGVRLRPHAQPGDVPRRGMNGLRLDATSARRTWP